jgi:molybdate transport system substrate-binding protein
MISAAASLREVITRASESFEEESPGVRVQLNFAGSGALRQQIEMGAPVNVFVSAATEHIDRLAESGLVDPDGRRIFARNRLVLIGAAEKVRSLADLRSDSVARVAIGDPRSVPAGNYARKWLEAEGLWPEIEEKTVLAGDVRQVLSYVERGEVDAGIVYATDAKLLGLQPILTATGPQAPEVVYEAAILGPMDESRAAARRFFDYLGSRTVTHQLHAAGFMAP